MPLSPTSTTVTDRELSLMQDIHHALAAICGEGDAYRGLRGKITALDAHNRACWAINRELLFGFAPELHPEPADEAELVIHARIAQEWLRRLESQVGVDSVTGRRR